MSEPIAFCPQCKNEVSFAQSGNTRRCPVCGFQYEIGGAHAREGSSSPDGISALGLVLRFVLILVALVVVALGVAFVGCAMLMKGF